MKSRVLALVALCSAIGCSTPTPFEGDEFESVRSQPAHPFAVEVELKQEINGTQANDTLVPAIVDTKRKAAIEGAIVRALTEYNTFSAAYGESADVPADLALEVTVSAPANRELGDPERNNKIWGSLFLWLLAGFPGWILEDTEMDTGVQMSYRIVRRFPELESEPEIVYGPDKPIDFAEAEKLNFWRRAGLWQYTQQIIIPPFLVKSDMEKADENLYARFTARMQQELGQRIKEDLATEQVNREGISIPYLHVTGSGNETYLLLFSDSELARGALERLTDKTALDWMNLKDPVNEEERTKMNLENSLDTALSAAAKSYGYIYRATVEKSALTWAAGATPTRLLVTFRGDERNWSWTPRVGTTPPPPTQTASAN